MDFWFWQRLCRARPGFWAWNGRKKIAGGGKWGYMGCGRQAKWKSRVITEVCRLPNVSNFVQPSSLAVVILGTRVASAFHLRPTG
jgi:hypothetical protein